MTQLNLLPDVKLEYLRASRQRRLVVAVSLLVAIVSVAVTLMLFSVAYVFQKKSVNDLDGDIKTYSSQLKQISDLDKVLTVQNQLNSLPSLHRSKPAASRVFDYLTQLTPTTANIAQLNADFEGHTLSITGTAKSIDVANTFIDTLKFTTYKLNDNAPTTSTDPKAFSNVVLSQFARNATTANYTITLGFDPLIFDNTTNAKLSVPKIISTRSATEQPSDLFQQLPANEQTRN